MLLTVMSVAACGDGSSNCSFTACGGSPVGDWQVTGACGTSTMGIGSCSGATANTHIDSASGTVSIRADMTYQVNLTTAGSFSATVPTSCVPTLTSCDQLAQALRGNGISNVACSPGVTASCNCTGKINASSVESGTWSVTGNQITTHPSGSSSSSTATFCQQANSLKVKTSNGGLLVLAK